MWSLPICCLSVRLYFTHSHFLYYQFPMLEGSNAKASHRGGERIMKTTLIEKKEVEITAEQLISLEVQLFSWPCLCPLCCQCCQSNLAGAGIHSERANFSCPLIWHWIWNYGFLFIFFCWGFFSTMLEKNGNRMSTPQALIPEWLHIITLHLSRPTSSFRPL